MTDERTLPQPDRFSADTRIGDAVRSDPNLPMILMRFHIGGCSMCGFDDADTIAQVAEDNGVPVDELLAALNAGSP